MTTLENYLATDYRTDREEIGLLERTLNNAANTFAGTFIDDRWPYDVRINNASPEFDKPSNYSQGTAAMALLAIGRLIDRCKGSNYRLRHDALSISWDTALKALESSVKKGSKRGSKKIKVISSSFGDNNPMTLSHLAELKRCYNKNSNLFANSLVDAFNEVSEKLNMFTEATALITPPSERRAVYQSSAFVTLRALMACKDLGQQTSFSEVRKFFESTLHDQLSFSAIPDSRFDPAELLFCLEGLLICAPSAVDATLFDRIIHVLADKQNTSAHWRPTKPFVASSTGSIMLPLSVEGANSFMRSVAIMDKRRTHDFFAAKSLPLLRRFWHWLFARSVRFLQGGKDCVGWHSEHVNEPNMIHIWDTTQVVEFMIAYHRFLAGHMARRSLDLSGVKVRLPKHLKESLPKQLKSDGSENLEATYDWMTVIADREPLLGSDDKDQVYLQVGTHFVLPRTTQPKDDKSYSMLLYGPPGTGKSTLAELMADALGWPMLTVTVSDFLGSGGAMVEARAKAIFAMLEAQRNTIILFDEIDAFLLDRDSQFYREQETLFQFLTPGMLTKINDLRKAKQSIFIIATNYANRIDPAIKRIGRIDHKLLLLPPNKARRKAMANKALDSLNEKKDEKLNLTENEIDDGAKSSCYLGWNDIESAIKEKNKYSDLAFASQLKKAERSTGARFYGRRFSKEKPFDDEIADEVKWLYILAKEVEPLEDFGKHFVEAAQMSSAKNAAVIKKEAETFIKDISEKHAK